MLVNGPSLNVCNYAFPGPGSLDIAPPQTLQTGQSWSVVLFNMTSRIVKVTTPSGQKWVPSFIADVFGSGCDTCRLTIDFNMFQPGAFGAEGGWLFFSWAFEPDSFRPDVYPHTLVGGAPGCGC